MKAGSYTFYTSHDDLDRIWKLHVPPQRGPLPVVFMLHGRGGSAESTRELYGFKTLADKEGFLAVFPEATLEYPYQPPSFKRNPTLWNEGSSYSFASKRGIDDIGFLRTILDHLKSKVSVDRSRIYFTGFSNGAAMAWRVGVEMSDLAAAIAPVAGYLWLPNPQLMQPVPLLYIIGDQDPYVPLNGNEERPPIQQLIDKWIQMNGITDEPQTTTKKNTVVTSWGPIVKMVIEGQGHEWPGIPRVLPEEMSGPIVNSINATQEIWNFFKMHRKNLL